MGSTTTSTALRSDSFPAGLRVLVVDHDPACLNILHKMLIKCKYEGLSPPPLLIHQY